MFYLKCLTHGVTLLCLHIWFGFNLNMSSWLSSLCWLYIYILVFCPLQHSLIAMSSCWIFWTKWMWSDPNLSMLSISNSISPSHMHSIETVKCLLCILVSRRHRDKHQVLLNDSSLLLKSGEVGTTIRHAWRPWERRTTLSMLHDCHMPLRCEPPGAPA